MRYMIIVKATADSEVGAQPEEALLQAMTRYHAELAQAGVLLDGSGLQPSSSGWRVCYSNGRSTIIDGPFAATKELVAGYTLIQVRSREEALEWTRRFPAPFGERGDGQIEVRQLYEPDENVAEPGAQRLRDIGLSAR